MPRLVRTGLMSLRLAMVAPAPVGALAQETAGATPDLAMRLPAAIDGEPVEVAFTDNLQNSGSCVAYVPTGTLDRTFESDVPSVWRIERDAATMSGTCWIADYPGFEHTATWDLHSVDQP